MTTLERTVKKHRWLFGLYTPQRFLGYNKETGMLVHILGLTDNGNWLSDRGYIYPPSKITEDLSEYAHRKTQDARDERDTLWDSLT